MPTPIRRITAAQFGLLAQPAQLTRKIAAVHVHHTGRPRRQDFRGLATVEAMRKFHMEQNGWSDLAQHLTIDPQGGLWTGRKEPRAGERDRPQRHRRRRALHDRNGRRLRRRPRSVRR